MSDEQRRCGDCDHDDLVTCLECGTQQGDAGRGVKCDECGHAPMPYYNGKRRNCDSSYGQPKKGQCKGYDPKRPRHSCPYLSVIEDNDSNVCRCCEDCADECAMVI